MEQTHSSRSKHIAPPTYTQPIQEKWVHSQGIQRVWFGRGGKEPIFSFQPGSLLGKCFVGITFCPKRMVDSWYYLMHAKEVSNKKHQSLICLNNRERLITKSNKGKFVME